MFLIGMMGCSGSPSVGTADGTVTVLDEDGNAFSIVVEGALSFDCARCDALSVVLTDSSTNFDCAWAQANYGTHGERVPDRNGSWNLLWDARYPTSLHAVEARGGVLGALEEPNTHILEVEMDWEEEGVQGALWMVASEEQLEFEADQCGRID